MRVRAILLYLFALSSLFGACAATAQTIAQQPDANQVETAWRLLDYMAVDYGGAVADGKVSAASEYAEQTEFAATVKATIADLPERPQQARLISGANRLQAAIAAKADAKEVGHIARGLAADLLTAYPVPLAPEKAPDFARGAALYKQNCAACHGLTGDGRGPDAANLATPPIAFTDRQRAEQRSLFALYQTITQGIDGTAMPSWSDLSSDDRWALALYAGHFAFSDAEAREGKRLWEGDSGLHDLFPDLKALADLRPADLAARIGEAKAGAVMAYLRRHPEAVAARPTSLSLVRSRLAASLEAYRSGDSKRARSLALSAYLDGFEPIEPTLGARDATLMTRIESAMGDYRAALQNNVPAADAATRVAVLNTLFDDAQVTLSQTAAGSVSTFLGAATILLREGLEALLIVVAMIAFLRKAERKEVLPYVHAGWIGALAAGGATWFVATYIIGISGASRELTEGFGSILAALVLLSVGIWMHGKAQAGQWQRYIQAKMSKALTARSAWFLFGLAFVVVYREVFETILFYAALWTQGQGGALLAGATTAVALLALIAWAMLRYSRTLPISQFFRYSAWLMAILTVVLAGKGVAALQEAGIINIAPLAGVPRISLVGLYPTWETLGAQILMLVALIIGFAASRRQGRTLSAS
jgi:high-affinity iron transporter